MVENTGSISTGRTADNLKYLRRRSLLLQRLGEVGGALAQFVEQPRVLDGDDGLGSEVLDELDLLVGKGANFLAVDGYCRRSIRLLFEHRDKKEVSALRQARPALLPQDRADCKPRSSA